MSKNKYNVNKESKKSEVLKENSKTKIYIVSTLFIVIIATVAFMFSGEKNDNSIKAEEINIIKSDVVSTTNSNADDQSGKELSYNIKDFDDMTARHYQYKEDNVLIKYFILKSSDGKIRAAFDACDSCWRSGKGYTQQGDLMVCNNCGLKFPSIKINEVRGGCNPVTLNTTTRGDKLIIKTSDIKMGQPYFNFPGRS